MTATDFEIRQVLHSDSQVDEVIHSHHTLMRSLSPEDSCHVMSANELRTSGALLFALYDEDGIQGVGALKALSDTAVELKSMHVLAQARGRNFGKAILLHLLEHAHHNGAQKAYLETGSEAPFAPARALYESLGFTYTAPFSDYKEDPLSVFMVRAL